MGSIEMYLKTQLYYKTLVAPPKNLTISETEIGWFEIMAGEATVAAASFAFPFLGKYHQFSLYAIPCELYSQEKSVQRCCIGIN
jgi:hypothetical protein